MAVQRGIRRFHLEVDAWQPSQEDSQIDLFLWPVLLCREMASYSGHTSAGFQISYPSASSIGRISACLVASSPRPLTNGIRATICSAVAFIFSRLTDGSFSNHVNPSS